MLTFFKSNKKRLKWQIKFIFNSFSWLSRNAISPYCRSFLTHFACQKHLHDIKIDSICSCKHAKSLSLVNRLIFVTNLILSMYENMQSNIFAYNLHDPFSKYWANLISISSKIYRMNMTDGFELYWLWKEFFLQNIFRGCRNFNNITLCY